MRLTNAELAKLAGVGFRTRQDMEQQRSEGSVQTMGSIFAVLSLKLGVVRAAPNAPATPANPRTDGHTPDQA